MRRLHAVIVGMCIAGIGVAATSAAVTDGAHHRAVRDAPAAGTCIPSSATRTLAAHGVTLGDLTTRQSLGSGGGVRPSYDWPLRPFDRQHPVRAFFDDPRVGGHGGHAFHFGIDIAAADGTPVYSAEAGRAYLNDGRAIAVVDASGRSLSYWHVVPSVHNGQYVARHQLIGHVAAGWGHVHFSEWRDGVYLNPLRPGGLGPYGDPVPPAVDELGLTPGPDGSLDAVVSAFDMPSPRVPGAWADEPVTPSLIQWRLLRNGNVATGWTTATDFATLLPAARYGSVYAPATRQNRAGKPGRYCFYLRTGRQLASLSAGPYQLQVLARDTRGNTVLAALPFRVG